MLDVSVVNIVAEAIISGAAVGLIKGFSEGVGEHTVIKAYNALKLYFRGRPDIENSIAAVEKNPSEQVYHGHLRQALLDSDVSSVEDLMQAAKAVVEAAKPYQDEIGYAVNFRRAEYDVVHLDEIESTGSRALNVEDSKGREFTAGPIKVNLTRADTNDLKKNS